ncbi:MAG TPA: (5-formylfuran-3-yl)methyl phosphate synthase [Acetobacteraceae bacterium]|nr:(5-formylfuran-3-yl)methyl phosphate synthase [Acetobacteraceae bacterium]
MLASVTGAAEAEIAFAGGADVIDLKDPGRGALGAVAPAVAHETVAAIAGRRPVSAVLGDLPMRPETVLAAAEAMAATGVDYLKLGIFAGGDVLACLKALAPLAAHLRLVAVLFADGPPDLSLLPEIAAAGFAGAMLDTQEKAGKRLLDWMDLPALRRFVTECRDRGLMAGLAGALEAPDVPRLLVLAPDLLGFRGALTGPGGRGAALDPERLREIRELIPPEGGPAGAGGMDYRLLAAGLYAPDPNGDPSLTDRVFVRDLVLPVVIGAYARERHAPQPVRFEVEAHVARIRRPTQDMRDVFSYDVITDGIRMLIAAGHVALVETLAERVAAMVLEHPRVTRVMVRLEKLQTGSGIVGVLIERTRDAGGTAPLPAGRA